MGAKVTTVVRSTRPIVRASCKIFDVLQKLESGKQLIVQVKNTQELADKLQRRINEVLEINQPAFRKGFYKDLIIKADQITWELADLAQSEPQSYNQMSLLCDYAENDDKARMELVALLKDMSGATSSMSSIAKALA